MKQDINTRVDLLERKMEDLQEQLDHLFSLLENDEFVETARLKLSEIQEQVDDIFAQLPKE